MTKKDYRQRWRLRIPNSTIRIPNSSRRILKSSRRIIKFSDKGQNSKRGLINSTDNRENYRH